MTPHVRTIRAKKRQNRALQSGYSLPGPLKESVSTESRVINEVVLEKRNSRKFAVASDPSSSARSIPHRHGASPAASKNGDYVAFVAPLCSKLLRLVTARLPEKYSPI